MSRDSNAPNNLISLPKGGGALSGIGETFSPDLHTGTGNFTVPIALPPGRNGLQPELNLVYSTGNGNSPFGLGWQLSVPGVSRKISKGVPRYDDRHDIFVLSGAEDLVPVAGVYPGVVRYRPRTEGLFAQIRHVRGGPDNYWEVRSKDGLTSRYGAPGAAREALLVAPARPEHVFTWRLTETRDAFGNRILYEYAARDAGAEGSHLWDQPLLTRIRYVDYRDASGQEQFLVSIELSYEPRPDPSSDYRAGYEIRNTVRCQAITVRTQAEQTRTVREYRLRYEQAPYNGVSLLTQIEVIGFDDAGHAYDDPTPGSTFPTDLPSLTFGYTRFAPELRRFEPLSGSDLPPTSLADPNLDLVDLFGSGLPDILQLNGVARYWRNRGDGRFDLPRPMRDAPAGLSLDAPGVQLIDANGNGRADLMVTQPGLAGYFPLQFGGLWDRRSFRAYRKAPSFSLKDPEVKLVDLDGDGVTDAIRSGTRLECFFNDPEYGWHRTRQVDRRALDSFPNVSFADSRVRLADMTGDGLQDVVLVSERSIQYWPNLGYGDWGRRVQMLGSLQLPHDIDPQRLLLGDVDGDGLADLVYVGVGSVTLWINQGGVRWSDPLVIQGTPPAYDIGAVRLADILGTGVSGVLWSSSAPGPQGHSLWFLDFTGGVKPYVLNEMDNHLGALTRVQYAPSTRYYREDFVHPATRWRTPLPFPVQVVAKVEVIDALSQGKLTTEYHYRHGYWDGGEREFRGFGMVEQRDTQTFADYNQPGLHGVAMPFERVTRQFAPPTLTRTWFHQGAVGDEYGDWEEWGDPQYGQEYWPGDPSLLERPSEVGAFLAGLPRRVKRDALRTLRGSVLRTELYALDGSDRQPRPYTVTESEYGICQVTEDGGASQLSHEPQPHDRSDVLGSADDVRVFFPYLASQRTTQWERGDDPLTQFAFTDDYDGFGQPRRNTSVALPRRSARRRTFDSVAGPIAPDETHILATHSRTEYATPDAGLYVHDRPAQVWGYELNAPHAVTEQDPDDVQAVLRDQYRMAQGVQGRFSELDEVRLISHTLHHYDGPDFRGRPAGELGPHGVMVRSEALICTDDDLDGAYGAQRPAYLDGPAGLPPGAPAGFGQSLGYRRESAAPYLGGYYADSARHAFGPRGLLLASEDPLGNRTRITYDAFQLLPVAVTDAAGLTTQAEYNYRVMQPFRVIDPNGNRSEFAFSPIGLLSATWLRGKAAHEGDQQEPSVRLEYDLLAFMRRREPAIVRSVRRVHHDAETGVPPPERDATIETREYSDGFGRLLQTRTQAEELLFGDEQFGGGTLPIDQGDGDATKQPITGRRNADAANPNVVVSGWQVYDNKGQVVQKYEPFFDVGWAYNPPSDVQRGQRVTLFYDPRGHAIRTLNPDGSEQRVIFGIPEDMTQPDRYAPTPWESYSYDANDLAPLSRGPHGEALNLRADPRHHYTPASIVIDALGRTLAAVERNGASPAADWFVTRSSYDIRGNLLIITDALGREAFRHAYDLADRRLRLESIDAGMRLTVYDARGSIVEQRDSRGAVLLHTYDGLNRPTALWASDDGTARLTLRERFAYGDQLTDAQDARQRNLLGRVHRHDDEAGTEVVETYDFKGNPLEKVRRVIADAAILAAPAFQVDWSVAGGLALDPREYRTGLAYDALNRIVQLTYPKDVEGRRQVLRPAYNRAGALEQVVLDRGGAQTVYVQHIAYNAKGQRTLVAHGNGVLTRHAYDPQTFRLARLRSEGYTRQGDTFRPTGAVLQDVRHEDDLVGNIIRIHDRAPNSGLPASPDRLDRAFGYDALYRLERATGRQCAPQPADVPWDDAPRCQDVTATRPYVDTYDYDALGNILALSRAAGVGSFTRTMTLTQGNNRLQTVNIGKTDFAYTYDANGNITAETVSRRFAWDHSDRLVGYRTEDGNGHASVVAIYLYDGSGMRVKKLVRKGNHVETTVYIDGIFEQRSDGAATNSTLHIMDDQSRIALVRVGPPLKGDGGPAVQYHLGDHLGSSTVVVDGAGQRVNREEYFPYGETSFGSFARKRYRFSGKERDEESGLSYFGARYCAPWVGRWWSCDPAGTVDGSNLCTYTSCNPINLIDLDGMQSNEPEDRPTETDPRIISETKVNGEPHIVLSNMTVTADIPFEPDVSIPSVKEEVEGRGHIEGQDVRHLGKGMWNGVASDWLGLPRFEVVPRHAGAAEMGRQLGQDLVYEVSGAIVAKAGGKLLAAVRAPKPWLDVRLRLGQELGLPPYTQVHHWLIPQGGKGKLTLKGFFGEQWGRFIPESVRNARWNLMVPPPAARGVASRAWHAGLHGKGPYKLGLWRRLWHGSPIGAKSAAATFPIAAGVISYLKEGIAVPNSDSGL